MPSTNQPPPASEGRDRTVRVSAWTHARLLELRERMVYLDQLEETLAGPVLRRTGWTLDEVLREMLFYQQQVVRDRHQRLQKALRRKRRAELERGGESE